MSLYGVRRYSEPSTYQRVARSTGQEIEDLPLSLRQIWLGALSVRMKAGQQRHK